MCRIKRLIISWSYVMYLNNFSKIATSSEFNYIHGFYTFQCACMTMVLVMSQTDTLNFLSFYPDNVRLYVVTRHAGP